ncbi:MAG: DUF3105 domain-containing protein [Chloroflexi bacterium]|nr:DUF3105 domain-containing protein [Chloroflexota bacterium]
MPKKKEHRVLTRRERLERQAEHQQRQRTRNLVWVGAGVVVVAAIVAAIVLLTGANQPAPGVAVPIAGNDHVPVNSPIRFDHLPPSSGSHFAQEATYGVQDAEVPEGYWVHNLEHGAVVVLYNCADGCPDLVAQLRDAYSTFPRSAQFNTVKLVVAPYPKLQTRLAYLAWGRELLTDTYNRDELFRFYQAYLDRGPELAP